MPSFDIVSELDKHEVQNAVDQANRELATRFDFKGVTASFELEKEENVNLEADADFQLRQMIELLKGRLIARGIDVRCLEEKDADTAGVRARQQLVLRQGLDQPTAKKIVKALKDAKLKVQAQIQGERSASPARSVTTCRAPWRCSRAMRASSCRCSSTTSAIDPARK